MTNNAELKLLCESLVANEFVLIHDAEQALELFERLTTPGLVLGLLNDEASQQDRPYLFALATDRQGCTLDIDGLPYHYVVDSRVEGLLRDTAPYRIARALACGYTSERGPTIVVELLMPNIIAPTEGFGELLDAAIDAYIDNLPKEARHADEA